MKKTILDYARSTALTFFALFSGFIVFEGLEPLNQLYQGNFADKAVWLALGFAILRSALKACLTILFPKVFPNGK